MSGINYDEIIINKVNQLDYLLNHYMIMMVRLNLVIIYT